MFRVLFVFPAVTAAASAATMPSPGNCAIKFLRSNLRRGAKPKVRIAVLGQASVGKTGERRKIHFNSLKRDHLA